MPEGDAWGGFDGLPTRGVCDRMVVGGAAAFRADARMWLAMRDNPGGLIRNGCGLAAQTRGLAIAGEPVALLAHAQCVCVGAHASGQT